VSKGQKPFVFTR